MNDARLKEIEDNVSYMVSVDDRIVVREILQALRESQAREAKLREAVIQINHGDGYYSHHKAIFQDGHPGTDRMVIHAGEQFEAESEALKETKP